MKIIIRPIRKRMMVHHSTEEYCLCSQDHFVYKYYYKAKKFEELCRIPPRDQTIKGRLKDTLARSWIMQQLSSSIGIGHITELPDGTLLILYDRVYLYRPGEGKKYAMPTDELMQNNIYPPLRNGVAVHAVSGHAYFGEYKNSAPSEIRIIKVDGATGQLSVCYTFSTNQVKHVHSIVYDHFRNRLWVTSGDSDEQCGIFYSDDEFSSLKKLGGGDQSWRAVNLFPLERTIYWGMDAGRDAPAEAINKLYRYDVTSKDKQEIAVIGNPAYHGTLTTNQQMFLGVNYEPGRKQNTQEEASLWFSDDGDEWDSIVNFPYHYSGRKSGSSYGYLYLPTGISPENKIVLTASNTQKYDFTLLQIDII
ncbi:hypothetical protein H0A36_01785 [Endozoicomonas sp. SM1973]|uniref:Uncharacterized protein n=1 Tax=Spartinivicinus marinus TaxID=2994442 RepID=A0A853I1V6_9GAMM|nr:hypothetical protein [Spartinivicinus marinus]MCX4030038.1 hypothetical protein [Spartinivicinus marinus]NYZ64718.1 hypothetical protein [Spartinivicinus marinus]